MLTTLVMTVIGPDRTGLVDSLARTVAAHDGNWLESRMCHLGGQFAGLMRVEIEASLADALRESIQSLTATDLKITVQADSLSPNPVEGSLAMVDLVGQDRPGLLREITSVLARHGLNVEELESELTAAPLGGGTLFKANATIFVPATVDLDSVGDDLERIATDLLVDIQFAPSSPV
ncbi:MAG: ACT domain-containing protein [Candidatus Synoicihabitans palmerolidicus]|nr:ACT domain-containing protein [Candidatus Synoicihabitans palmerolidicus]